MPEVGIPPPPDNFSADTSYTSVPPAQKVEDSLSKAVASVAKGAAAGGGFGAAIGALVGHPKIGQAIGAAAGGTLTAAHEVKKDPGVLKQSKEVAALVKESGQTIVAEGTRQAKEMGRKSIIRGSGCMALGAATLASLCAIGGGMATVGANSWFVDTAGKCLLGLGGVGAVGSLAVGTPWLVAHRGEIGAKVGEIWEASKEQVKTAVNLENHPRIARVAEKYGPAVGYAASVALFGLGTVIGGAGAVTHDPVLTAAGLGMATTAGGGTVTIAAREYVAKAWEKGSQIIRNVRNR